MRNANHLTITKSWEKGFQMPIPMRQIESSEQGVTKNQANKKKK